MQCEKDLTSSARSEDGGRNSQTKECKWPLELGKGKKADSPVEPLEGNVGSPANTLILVQ